MRKNFDVLKEVKKRRSWLLSLLVKPLNSIGKKFPALRQPLVVLALGVVMLLAVFLWLFEDQLKSGLHKVLGFAVEATPTPLYKDLEKDNSPDSNIELDRVDNKCKGAEFLILSTYFGLVEREKFFEENVGVSARGTEYYQASTQTKWGCNLPFVAQVVSVPVKGSSFGQFLEYKDMLRVIVGDGDRVTLKVEQNKWGPRTTSWVAVRDVKGSERQRLGNPIEDGEEVTLVMKAKEKNGWVHLRVEIYHSKFQSVEIFNYSFIPNAVNVKVAQKRAFRVGINDFRFKGKGSVVEFKTLSVDEKEW